MNIIVVCMCLSARKEALKAQGTLELAISLPLGFKFLARTLTELINR